MDEDAGSAQPPAMLLLGAAIMLEASLLLHWRVPAFSNADVSVFGSADDPRRTAAAVAAAGRARDVWSAVPLVGVLLALLGLAAIVFATRVIGRRPLPPPAAELLALGGAAAAAYCAARLAQGHFNVYSVDRFADVNAILADHGPGVVLALCAAVVLSLTAGLLAVRGRQSG